MLKTIANFLSILLMLLSLLLLMSLQYLKEQILKHKSVSLLLAIVFLLCFENGLLDNNVRHMLYSGLTLSVLGKIGGYFILKKAPA